VDEDQPPRRAGERDVELAQALALGGLVDDLRRLDNVIVVEPAQIVDEAAEGQGLRELYVALTRPTRRLILVHSRPLPAELKWNPQ